LAGRVTADLILRGKSDLINAPQLSIKRFAQGRLLNEPAIL